MVGGPDGIDEDLGPERRDKEGVLRIAIAVMIREADFDRTDRLRDRCFHIVPERGVLAVRAGDIAAAVEIELAVADADHHASTCSRWDTRLA